jgi:hypothetical protein
MTPLLQTDMNADAGCGTPYIAVDRLVEGAKREGQEAGSVLVRGTLRPSMMSSVAGWLK